MITNEEPGDKAERREKFEQKKRKRVPSSGLDNSSSSTHRERYKRKRFDYGEYLCEEDELEEWYED